MDRETRTELSVADVFSSGERNKEERERERVLHDHIRFESLLGKSREIKGETLRPLRLRMHARSRSLSLSLGINRSQSIPEEGGSRCAIKKSR